MSDAYGIYRWTCGECGEVFEASGVVGEDKMRRWRREHKEEHRREVLSPEERLAEDHAEAVAFARWVELRA